VRERYESLSSREQEVLVLVVRGLLNKQIASKLGISEATVKMHRGHVNAKMHAGSLADLIRTAENIGLPATNRARTSPKALNLYQSLGTIYPSTLSIRALRH